MDCLSLRQRAPAPLAPTTPMPTVRNMHDVATTVQWTRNHNGAVKLGSTEWSESRGGTPCVAMLKCVPGTHLAILVTMSHRLVTAS